MAVDCGGFDSTKVTYRFTGVANVVVDGVSGVTQQFNVASGDSTSIKVLYTNPLGRFNDSFEGYISNPYITSGTDTLYATYTGATISFDIQGHPGDYLDIDTPFAVTPIGWHQFGNTVFYANGCAKDVWTTVYIAPRPDTTVGYSELITCGDSVLLEVLADSVAWYKDGVYVGSGTTFRAGETGTYHAVSHNELGFALLTDDVDVYITGNIVADITVDSTSYPAFYFEAGNADPAKYDYEWLYSTGTHAGDTFTYNTGAASGTHMVVLEVTDRTSGCTAYDTVYVINTTSLSRVLPESDYRVYPNPITERVTVELQGDFSYQLFTINGHLVADGAGYGTSTLDVSGLDAGFYFIRMSNQAGVATVKVVKR